MPSTFTFLGTGTSAGIPIIACDCPVCQSDDPRDQRTRASALITYTDTSNTTRNIFIDTSPDLRQQVLRHDLQTLDAIVYTHYHADHVFGLDDVRRFNAVMDRPIDIYAERSMLDWLHQTFNYIFDPHKNTNRSFIAQLTPNEVHEFQPFELFGKPWLPVRLMHGRLPILGFRIDNLAYCTDCSSLDPQTYTALENLDTLIIDALRYRHHPTHLTVDQALNIIDHLQPKKAYLTHIAHDISHADLEAKLPTTVHIAYDGLQIPLT